MGLIRKITERTAGRAQAHRDVALVKMFIQEHGGMANVPHEVGARFFKTLGDEAPRRSTEAGRAYGKIVDRFIATDPEIKQHFPRASLAASLGADVLVTQLSMADIIKLMPSIVPLVSAEELDDIVKAHGHGVDDEDCDIIQALRLRRQQAQERGEI